MKRNHAVAFTVGFMMGMASIFALNSVEQLGLWLVPFPFAIVLTALWMCGRWKRYDESARGQP